MACCHSVFLTCQLSSEMVSLKWGVDNDKRLPLYGNALAIKNVYPKWPRLNFGKYVTDNNTCRHLDYTPSGLHEGYRERFQKASVF
jgi:hypothetical protein